MKAPPKKLADQVIRAVVKARDSQLHGISPAKQATFSNRAQTLFKKVVRAMDCSPSEEWMVSENIGRIVSNIAPSKRPPR